jgi:hypothetical protein
MMASSGAMRDLGRRLLIGLAVVAAGLMAIGYALIAGRIAAPIGGDLGTFPTPTEAGATAVLLDDGRPAFIVADGSSVTVIDARGRHAPGEPGRLVAWCVDARFFGDLLSGATYATDGRLLGGPAENGLVVYPVRSVEDGSRIAVGSDGQSAGIAPGERIPLDCPTNDWAIHQPEPGEVFDPSVAVDQEPPGWIWLEGELVSTGSEVRLCDGRDGQCLTGAPVRGIDPARVSPLSGSFIGRVRDDAIEGLAHVPEPGGTR